MIDRFAPLHVSQEKRTHWRVYPNAIITPVEEAEEIFDNWLFWLLEFEGFIRETLNHEHDEWQIGGGMKSDEGDEIHNLREENKYEK